MVSKNHKHCKPRQEPRSYRVMRNQKPELAEFFESVDERMKSLAVARKPYKARNDKELTVKPGDVFEVLDDDGAWWCLRAPSGKTGHVPKYHLEPISNPMAPYGRNYDPPTDPIVVKVPVIVKTSVHKEASEEPARSRTPPARTQQQQRPVTRSASPAPASASPPPPPPTPLSRSLSQIQPSLSSSRLERSPESRPEVRTYIKEIVRRSPEPIRGSRFIRSTSRRPRRHSGSSSSSDDDSSNYENEPKKSYAPRAARSSRAQTQHSPAGRNCSKIPHCCESASCHVHCFRHSCAIHCPKEKKTCQTPPQSPARSEQSQQQQQQDKQPQQVFIILEPPKQEQPPEVEPPEEYQDACQTAPIQILLTPGGQFTSSMTVAPQFPQYGQAQQAAMQMCAPATIQWPCQPYYPTYV